MSVPSFSSFPDLPVDRTTETPKPLQRSSKKRKDGARHKKDKRIGRPGKGTPERSKHDDEKDKERTVGKESSASVQELATSMFYSDRKGDRYNIEYGGLYAGDVPRYHLVNRKLS